ncbi:DNA polymerase III subunit delta [Breznakiellaceae bacterium SP9]
MAKGKVLLYLGPELGEKQEAIDELRKQLSGKAALEENSFYAGETPAANMVSTLRNGSLFSDARLFFIKNAELLSKEESTLLCSYIKSPAEATVLVFLSEANSINKEIEAAAGAGAKKIFYELFENRKHAWVENFFYKSGCRIEKGAVDTILELVENNTDALKRECSRLILFLDKDSSVNTQAVEKWLSHSREESSFTLFTRIAQGDFTLALDLLRTLLAAKESPIAIFAGLTYCFKRLRDYECLMDKGLAHDDFELKKVGIAHPKSRQDYASAARLYRADTCLSLVAEYDILLRRSGAALETLLMDMFLYAIFKHSRNLNKP